MSTHDEGHEAQKARIIDLVRRVQLIARETSLVFVTNINSGPVVDLDARGVVNAAQYYSEAEADTIIRSFREVGFHVLPFFSEADFMRAVLSGDLDRTARARRVVFTAAEGGTGAGRRALLPAFCRLAGLLFCNSGPHGCSVARHKYHANAILRRAGVSAPEAWLYHPQRGWIGGCAPVAGTRVIVKPTYESMAIGVDESSVCDVDADFERFVRDRARAFAQPATVQVFVVGREIGVPIVELDAVEALPPVEFVIGDAQRFSTRPRTFAQENLTGRVAAIPLSDIPRDLHREICRAAVTAFEALDMAGMGRIDMRIDGDGRIWVFDTNESPPPLAGSSYHRSVETFGLGVPEMLALWVGVALQHGGALPAP